MKSYGLRNGVAQFLNMPRDRVRVVWMDGPQAFGRTAADDAGFEAAFLAKELGRPVRVSVDAAGRNGVGHQGSRFCHQDPRRPGRAGQPRRDGLGGASGRPQSRRLQRAGHRARRPAHRRPARDARARQQRRADRGVRHSQQAHRTARGLDAARVGKRRCAPATFATRTARRPPSRPSHSSTSSRRPLRQIRWNSG